MSPINNLQQRLTDFEGELLIPLNYQTYKSSRIVVIPREGYMYIQATVTKDHVLIPAVGCSFDKSALLPNCPDTKIPIIIFLTQLIQSDPTLLKTCKLHRIGYDPSKVLPTGKSLLEPLWISRRREETFVKNILKKKGDFKNLEAYIAAKSHFYTKRV